MRLTMDELAPRVLRERYRLYRRKPDGDLQVIATVASPEAVGVALVTLAEEGEFEGCALGVLDVCPGGEPAENGRWLVKPFTPRP